MTEHVVAVRPGTRQKMNNVNAPDKSSRLPRRRHAIPGNQGAIDCDLDTTPAQRRPGQPASEVLSKIAIRHAFTSFSIHEQFLPGLDPLLRYDVKL